MEVIRITPRGYCYGVVDALQLAKRVASMKDVPRPIYILGQIDTTGKALFVYLTHFSHFVALTDGLFDSADLAYYLLFVAAFLALSIRRLDNLRLQR